MPSPTKAATGTAELKKPAARGRRGGRAVAGPVLRIVVPYLIVGSAWILFSDRMLLWLTYDPRVLVLLSTAKGWLYVLVTGLLLFVLATRELGQRVSLEIELRENLREKNALLFELNHRVKNNLQVLSSILALEAEGLDSMDLRNLIDRTRARVRVMALAHERLFEGSAIGRIELGGYLSTLWDMLAGIFGGQRAVVRFEVQEIWADAEEAVPFGLIAAEAMTNAIRFGSRPGSEGAVSVALRRREDGSAELSIKDEGPGLAETAPGLGTRLMEALAGQLHGMLELYSSGGAVVSLRLPSFGGKNG